MTVNGWGCCWWWRRNGRSCRGLHCRQCCRRLCHRRTSSTTNTARLGGCHVPLTWRILKPSNAHPWLCEESACIARPEQSVPCLAIDCQISAAGNRRTRRLRCEIRGWCHRVWFWRTSKSGVGRGYCSGRSRLSSNSAVALVTVTTQTKSRHTLLTRTKRDQHVATSKQRHH